MDRIDPTNIYTLLMLLAFVMRRAGTFTMEEKVRMIEFIGRVAANPDREWSLRHMLGP